MLGTMFASLTAKIAGVALAATVATTGALAATGTLPAPAQQAVANVAAKVGISIPNHSDTTGSQGNRENSFADVTPTVTPTVTPSVSPTVTPSPTPTSTATDAVVNHGACVSYATQEAGSLGLTGSEHGAFVSMIAQNSSAVSAKVATGGQPSAACLTAIAQAEAAVKAANGSSPTATVTSSPTGTATSTVTGKGNSSSHPTGKPSDLPTPSHPGHS